MTIILDEGLQAHLNVFLAAPNESGAAMGILQRLDKVCFSVIIAQFHELQMI